MDSRPIGLFDSGVGGLSVLSALRRLAPAEDLLYFADTLWFPYGGRPAAEVRKRSFAITRRLLDAGVKAIVVACNTASAAGLNDLRQAFDVPFIGMVPGLKPAVAASPNGSVAILATPGTLGGHLYARVAEDFGASARVNEIPAHGLAEVVEAGDVDSPQTLALLHEFLDGPVARGADTVVLGCTHYAFLEPQLRREFPGLTIVDTSEPVARRTLQVLHELAALAPDDREGHISLIVSGDGLAFEAHMRALGFEPAMEVTA